MDVFVNDITTLHLDPVLWATGKQIPVALLKDMKSPLRSTKVLCVSLVAGVFSHVKVDAILVSERRVVGAQPELWSITDVIAAAVAHRDRMKKKTLLLCPNKGTLLSRRHKKHIEGFFRKSFKAEHF